MTATLSPLTPVFIGVPPRPFAKRALSASISPSFSWTSSYSPWIAANATPSASSVVIDRSSLPTPKAAEKS